MIERSTAPLRSKKSSWRRSPARQCASLRAGPEHSKRQVTLFRRVPAERRRDRAQRAERLARQRGDCGKGRRTIQARDSVEGRHDLRFSGLRSSPLPRAKLSLWRGSKAEVRASENPRAMRRWRRRDSKSKNRSARLIGVKRLRLRGGILSIPHCANNFFDQIHFALQIRPVAWNFPTRFISAVSSSRLVRSSAKHFAFRRDRWEGRVVGRSVHNETKRSLAGAEDRRQ